MLQSHIPLLPTDAIQINHKCALMYEDQTVNLFNSVGVLLRVPQFDWQVMRTMRGLLTRRITKSQTTACD